MRLTGLIHMIWVALALGLSTGVSRAETRTEHRPIERSDLSSCETDRDLVQRIQQEFEFILAAVERYQSESRENPKQFRRGRSRQQLCEELLEPLVSETVFFENFLIYTRRVLRNGYEPTESGDLSYEDIIQLIQMIESAFWNENARIRLFHLSDFCSKYHQPNYHYILYQYEPFTARDRREFLESFNHWVDHYIDYAPNLIADLGSLQEQLRLDEETRGDSL